MKLTRQLFPLLFELVLIFCDATVDAPEQVTEEVRLLREERRESYDILRKKQDELIAKLKETIDSKEKPNKERLEELYCDTRELDANYMQKVVGALEHRKLEMAGGWSIIGIIKILFSMMFMISIVKMLCFPTV